MSSVQMGQGMGGSCHVVPVFELRLSDLRDGRHGVPGHEEASVPLVPGDVVRNQPEEWRQRAGFAAGPRAGELSDRLVVAAQIAARHGSTRSRSADGLGGSVGSPEEGTVGRGVQDKA